MLIEHASHAEDRAKSAAALKERNTLQMLLFMLPILLTVGIMIPRLLSPQFGFLDDGNTISAAQEILNGTWSPASEASTGRYRPVYWLYYALLYAVSGPNPLGFFLGNLFLFVLTTACLMIFVRLGGGSRLHAWLAGMLFSLSGPIVESFYTLSKSEPLQVLFILISMMSAALLMKRRGIGWSVAMVFLSILSLLLAALTKETTLVIAPLAVLWFVVGWILRYRENKRGWVIPAAIYSLASFLAAGIFFLTRRYYMNESISAGSYTGNYDLDLSLILPQVYRWIGWLLHDFPYIFVLVVFFVVFVIVKRKIPSALFVICSLLWMLAWIGIFLPWVYMIQYYMLPFSLGCVILSGYLVELLIKEYRGGNAVRKVFAGGFLALTGLFIIVPAINNINSARLQLAVDAANTEMLKYAVQNIPQGGRLVINVPHQSEYWQQISLLTANVYQRPDIEIQVFTFQKAEPGVETSTNYLLVSPFYDNRVQLAVRLGIYEDGTENWGKTMQGFLGQMDEPDQIFARSFQLLNIDYLHQVCKFVDLQIFCDQQYPFLDRRLLSYGWNVHEVEKDVSEAAFPAVFQGDGTWQVKSPAGDTLTIPFGQAGDQPFTGDVDGDGNDDLVIYRPTGRQWLVDTNLDGNQDLTFSVPEINPEDIPVLGDWDGSGIDSPGYYRAADSSWVMFNDMLQPDPSVKFTLYPDNGKILIGDWNGDGKDTIGIYRGSEGKVTLDDGSTFDIKGDWDYPDKMDAEPVAGDWGGSGSDTLAFFVDGDWMPRPYLDAIYPPNLAPRFQFGSPGSIPLSFRWSGE